MDLQKQTAPAAASPPAASELRASDADRDRVADILRDALAEGRLTAEEHAERVEDVYRAKTVGELEPLVRDLPGAHQVQAAPAYVSVPNRPTPGEIPADPDDNVVAVFSSAVRKGRWRAGRRIHAYSVFGSVEIDLSEAIFEYQQVVIKAFTLFGNIEVRVPENVSLRGAGGGVLGNFEVDTLDATDPQAPVVFVDGWAVLGNIEARPKRGKIVADILDRVQRKVDKSLRKHLSH
ncbi:MULTISPECIES: DUF1707 SHOCT-like domain-containing protein [Streptomyces]|uniref:DUF1707 and DUF2154 domain-containing protein n=1 Tax=Streptomyces cadmiisoli TaxID=2184053 RepID=A0A2Z4IXZ6_9ACTN|nr:MULTISPECIES: DUF1707 domain-containing protein [Streptomyces]AWW37801.1 DUF1707 and DUF2154 domain-containing protein [Streptomyces cadmiisoli]